MRIIQHFKNNKANSFLLLGLIFKTQIFVTAIIFSYPGLETSFLEDLDKIPDSLAYTSNFYVILFILLLQPAIEEMMFRWHIGAKNNRIKTKMYITGISLLLIFLFLSPFESLLNFFLLVPLLISVGLNFLNNIRCNYEKVLFAQIILSSISFSFSHGGSQAIFVNPSIVSVTFILFFIGSGFIYSYLRINYGLLWAILIHFLSNLLLTAPGLFSNDIDKTPIEHTNSCYDMTVAESGKFDSKALFKISKDTLKWETLNLAKGLDEAIYFNNFDVNFFTEKSADVNEEILDKYSQKQQLRVYKVTIAKKDSCKVDLKELLKVLEKEGLMVKFKND